MERGQHPGAPQVTKEAETAPPENEALYRVLVESSSELIVLVDSERRCSYANPSFARVFGAVSAFPVERFHHDDREALCRAFGESTAGAGSVTVLRYFDVAGKRGWLECSTSPVRYNSQPHVL